MRSAWIIGAAAVLAVTLSACGNSTGAAAGAAPTGTTTTAAVPSPAGSPAAPAAADSGKAAPTALDPCQLVTRQEASALAHTSFGPGREESDPGGAKRCIYGYQTKNVFLVAVVRAASAAQARTEKDALRAQAEQTAGTQFTLATVSGVGDDAEFAQANLALPGGTLNISGLYMVKGAIGFAIVDAVNGAAAPSKTALIAQSQTSLGRVA